MDIKRRPSKKDSVTVEPIDAVESHVADPDDLNHAKSTKKTGTKRKYLVIASILVVMALGSAFVIRYAIERLYKQQLSKIPKMNLNLESNNGRLTFKTADGRSVSTGGKLPADFPGDVLIYSGSTIRTAIASKDSTNVILYVPNDSATVIETYKAESAKNGWHLVDQGSAGKITVLNFDKDNRRLSVQITASTDAGKPVAGVNLTVSQK